MLRPKILKKKYLILLTLATNTHLNAKINEVKNEIPSITNLATTAALNAKINEVKNEIPKITNLASTTALTAVENKIPNVSNLVKKTDYNTKITEVENKITTDHDHDKYITIQEFNKITAENFTARLAQANLASKNDIANLVKKTDLNKNELNELPKKVKAVSTKRLTKDLINKFSTLNGAKYFSSGIFQDYLLFIPAKKYIKCFSGTTRIHSWKSNGMSEENIENIVKLDSNFAPMVVGHQVLPDINFNGHCLINNIYIPKKVINIYISYTLNPWLRNLNTYFTLRNCLFSSVKLTKNADPDKYKYSGYGIGFDSRSEFVFTDREAWEEIALFLEMM